MKKILIALVLLTIGLVGCKKDETNGIVNTSWTYTEKDYDGWKYVYQISFLQGNAALLSYKEYDEYNRLDYSDVENGTYVYNHPTVTVTIDGYSMTGTISGNNLILDGRTFVKD